MKHKIIKPLKGGSDESVVNLIEIDGKHYVHKKAPKKTIIGEKFFHRTLDRNGLPSFQMFAEYEDGDNDVVFEYVENSPSLNENRSIDNFAKLGLVVSDMHDITYSDFFNIDDEGNPTVSSWSNQLAKYIQQNFDEFLEVNNESKQFSQEEVRKIEELIKPLAFHNFDKYSLVHGDMHTGNVMMKDGQPIPYDSFGEFMVAPAVYDLGLILSEEFNSSLFVEGDDEKYQRNKEHLDAFMDTYGRDKIETQMDLVKRFALLRAMGRFPNPWKDNQVEMMKNILKSYS